MSSVALPAASTTGSAFRTEADLARKAARSDEECFEEIYRRHSQTAWRLAQAVSPDRTQAVDAVADGFARVLRALRRRQADADAAFRPQMLSAVYRAAMDQARQAHAASADPAAETGTAGPLAAFRSLPERWRAALWLSEVERLDTAAVATVLAVSDPVAGQLIERGRQGLVARFAQAGIGVTEHLDAALRPLAADVPASMHDVVVKRWSRAVSVDTPGRLAPAAGWLTERTAKPLSIACGGLVALGMIGLGVLTVSSSPVASGPTASINAPLPNGGPPVTPSGPGGPHFFSGPGGAGGGGFVYPTATSSDASTPLSPTAAAAAFSPVLAGEGTPALPSGAGPVVPPAPPAPAAHATAGGGTNPGGTPVPTAPAGGTILTVPGLANATAPAGGGVRVVLVPPATPASSPVLGVALAPHCTGIQVLSITLGCVNPTAPAAAPASSGLLPGLLAGLGLG